MKPLLFGPTGREVYGVLHRASGTPRGHGVALCHPAPFDYMRLRWAHRRLAELLARAGFDVLRFDFCGTGDSALPLAEVSLQTWAEDTALAAAELADACQLGRVDLAGFGLAGSVAALACASGDASRGLWLIDPVVEGASHLRQLAALDAHRDCEANWSHSRARGELFGMALPPALEAGLRALDLLGGPPPQARHVLLIDTDAAPGHAGLQARLEQAGLRVARRALPAIRDPFPEDLEDARLSAAWPEALARAFAEEAA